ncbi:MAG: hypothetical protein ACUVTP_01845 [Candidatus Fervidibacter sp.]|uniref:hypothetical protein n=1 Tax=Candidatus Fervidibacter sp. TaxID=3100871 RepID=UPI00404AF7F6
MREADWVERLWQQVNQLTNQVACKEDVNRLEGKLESLAQRDALEKLAGKLDTLLINAATKVEVGRIESRLEHVPSREDFQKLEVRLSNSLPQIVTKQEWSAMESRLARTLTKDEFVHAISPLKEAFDSLEQQLSEVSKQFVSLSKTLWLLLAFNILTLLMVAFLLLKSH